MDTGHFSFPIHITGITGLLVLLSIGPACRGPEQPPSAIPTVAAAPPSEGISFNEVLAVLRTQRYDPAHLPLKAASLADIRSPQMLKDAGRTLDSTADLLPPFRRLLHPNGICLAGEWVIEKDNLYSGLFKAGTHFPLIARISPATDNVAPHKGHPISIGLVGKVFPNHNPDRPVNTANFITQTDIGGIIAARSKMLYAGLVMTNAPDTTAIHRGLGVPAFAALGRVLDQVDVRKLERQLYPLAEANKSGEPTRTPAYMKLTLNSSLETSGPGRGQDIRLEIWEQLQRRAPLLYDITLSDEGHTEGPDFLRKAIVKWDTTPVGKLVFTEAILSEPCDDQIHFRHPPWREDVNDPASSVRKKRGAAFGQPLGQTQQKQ